MATNEKFPGKSRPSAGPAPISIQAEITDAHVNVAAEPVSIDPLTVEKVAADSIILDSPIIGQVATEPVEVKAVAPSGAATLGALPSLKSPETKKAAAEFDACALPLKTLDLFSENAAAVLDFAAALGKAKSFSDAIELQSRFASERYSTLLRQTNDIAELTRRLTFGVSAPVRLSFSAFTA